MSGETELRTEIVALAEQVGDLHLRAHTESAAVVEDLLRTNCRDPRRIEHTLDRLLDFCGSEKVLQLYRRLCRHYFTFDSAAAVYYAMAYREMHGSDGAEVGE